MTVNTATSTASYTGNGTTAAFPVPFYFLVDTDLKVSRKLASTGAVSVLTLNSDYTLAGSGNQLGGTLTMAVIPATGDQLFIERNVTLVQQTSYPENNKFPSASHEKALDRLTMVTQQLDTKVGRALISDPFSTTFDLTGKVMINSGTAVNGSDLPGLAQVQSLVVGAAGGIIPTLVVTFPQLSASNGASLLGYQPAGTGAISRSLETVLREASVSVKSFGAVGNGVADDGPAIQLATNYAAGAGKELFFPAGTYRLLTFVSWPSNTKWRGEPGSVIQLDPSMTQGVSIGGSGRSIFANGVAGVSLEGLTFQSAVTGLTKSITICFNSTSQIRINNCIFQNFGNVTWYAQGLVAFASSDMRWTNSKFLNCSGDGAAIGSGCTDFQVSGCEFSNNADWGLALTIACDRGVVTNNLFRNNTSTATGADRCTNIVFSNNTMVNNSHGVRVCKFAATADVNHYITISGNVINGAGIAGISIEQMVAAGQCTVTGNIIAGSGGPGVNLSDSSAVSVNSNSIQSCAGAAVLVQSFTAGFESGRHAISGNVMSACPYGVQQITGPGTISKISVVANSIENMTTARTSLLAGNADYIVAGTSFFDASAPFNFPSGLASGTASAGSLTPPSVWQYMPIYVGGILKKIAVYNP